MITVEESMLELAGECETRSNPDDVHARYVTAYALMWAARGGEPEDARGSPISFHDTFMRKLDAEAYESAAMMLMPVMDRQGPGHYGTDGGSYYPFSFGIGAPTPTGDSLPTCTIDNPFMGGETVASVAPLPGLAMIAAILRAEAKWQLWRTDRTAIHEEHARRMHQRWVETNEMFDRIERSIGMPGTDSVPKVAPAPPRRSGIAAMFAAILGRRPAQRGGTT